jgi:hypothetical protein
MIFELLPGHGRWGVNLIQDLASRGAQIRENADALITEVLGGTERIICGIEYCGALPAGNQAWQRHGRALSFAQSATPYLIFNEIGGTELSESREAKASRYPNPSAPFALLLASKDQNSIVLPVYEPAASASDQTREDFSEIFGLGNATKLMAGLVLGADGKSLVADLFEKALNLVELLSGSRKKKDTLASSEWRQVLAVPDRLSYLRTASRRYVRRTSDKVKASKTAPQFMAAVTKSGALSFYSSALPITWIPKESKSTLFAALTKIYGESFNQNGFETGKDLVIVFVTGFKPRGDDSRPDRGLTPLARMLAGPNVELLTFLWGPAKEQMLQRLKVDYHSEAGTNGLIEAIVSTSDFVLVDSVTHAPFMLDTRPRRKADRERKGNEQAVWSASEHDVDSVIHFVVTQPIRSAYFEGLCNPPGGDWSGVSLRQGDKAEVRWTSLPRVSATSAKRPDHVVQISSANMRYVIAIESKLNSTDMDQGVGPNLIRYLDELMRVRPNVQRESSDSAWQTAHGRNMVREPITKYSAAAFRSITNSDLNVVAQRSDADLVIGVCFDTSLPQVSIRLKAKKGKEFLAKNFRAMVESSSFDVKVEE